MKFKLKDGILPVKENQITPSPQMMAVAVALPVHEIYSYSIPKHLAAQASAGKRVLVPFGGRSVTGYLLGPARDPKPPEIKPILDVLDDRPLFPGSMLLFFEWISRYYMHPLGQVITTALPAGLNRFDVALLTITPAGEKAMASPAPLFLGNRHPRNAGQRHRNH